MKLKKELAHYLDTLKFLSESTKDYLFLWDFPTRRIYFTDAIYEKYDLTRAEDGGHSPEAIAQLIYFRDLPAVRKLLLELESGSIDSCDAEVRLVDRLGHKVWYSFQGKTHFDEEGRPQTMLGRISDTVMNKSVDSLTGVLNESRFLKDMDECLKQDKKGFLMIVGIDNFKSINLKHGRGYGNYVLKNMAEIMEDVVDTALDIYRLNGDRYAANLTGCSEVVVQAIYLSLQEKLAPYCTVSAGAVSYGVEIIKDSGTLYQYAEVALDHAKKNGKNKLEFFSSEDYENNLCTIELLEELRNSVAQGFQGFSLCYQPQFSCNDCRIVGAEALLRYESPKQGVLSPDKFIPILEQTELIIPVGEWVLETALQQCRQWQKYLPGLHVSVNISYVQLCVPEIVENVLNLLQKTGVPGESLILEVTESMQLQDYQYFNRIFYTWRRCGIQIAIDDFGTGYSSLGYLKSMEINEIKLDRCLVSHIHHTPYNYHLIRNIIELAHSAQIRVCCEGVELKEEFLALKEIDADILQGFLLARPLSVQMFEAYYIEKDNPLYIQKTEALQTLYSGTETGGSIIPAPVEKEDITTILDNMDEVIYVSDVDSYELYYLNPAGRMLTGMHDYKGRKCYKVLQGRNDPCEFCTNHLLESGKFHVWEMENSFWKHHFMLKDKLIPWQGKMARMEIAIDITEKEYVSQSIQEKLEFEKNIVFCIKTLREEADPESGILKVLQAIGEFYKADRSYIFEATPDGMYWNNTYEWNQDGVIPQQDKLQRVPTKILQRWVDSFHRGEPVVILNLEQIQKICYEEWELLHTQGIRRLLIAPIKKDKKVIAFIGVDNPRHCHGDAAQLNTMSYFLSDSVGEYSANGLVPDIWYNKVLKSIRLGLWMILPDFQNGNSEMYGDQTMLKIMGVHKELTPEELYDHWYTHINEGYYDYVEKGVEKMIDSGKNVQLEYTWNHPDIGKVIVQCMGIRSVDRDGTLCLLGYHRIIDKPEHLPLVERKNRATFEYDGNKHSIYFHNGRELLSCNSMQDENFPESWIRTGIVHPRFADRFREFFLGAKNQEVSGSLELLLKAGNNRYEWFKMKGNHLGMGQKDQNMLIVQLHLIQFKMQLRQKYIWKNAFYEAMLSETIAYAEVELGCCQPKTSGGLWQTFTEESSRTGESFIEILENHLEEQVHYEDVERFRQFVKKHLCCENCPGSTKTEKLSFRNYIDGEYQWMKLIVHIFQDDHTNKMYGLLYLKNIDSEKRQELELKKAASKDPLTGVYNCTAFQNEVQKFMAQSNETRGGALIIFDLDDFKQINDQYGHAEGDKALKTLTKILRMTFRHEDLIGRLGGDEFLAFIKRVNNKEILNHRLDDLFSVLQCSSDIPLHCSVGVTFVSREQFSYHESLEQADSALYESKRLGKNRYSYYDEIKI